MSCDSVLRVRGIPKAKTTQHRFLLEQPPDYHLIHRNKGYYVPLPWTYYYIIKDMGYYMIRELSVSPVRIRTQNNNLYISPLPNLAGGNRPCYHLHQWDHRQESEFSNIACGLQDWWDARSNNDYWSTMIEYNRDVCEALAGQPLANNAGSLTKMLHKWQKFSLEQMSELPWRPLSRVRNYRLRLVDKPFINDQSLQR